MKLFVLAKLFCFCVGFIQSSFGQDCPKNGFIVAEETEQTFESPGFPNNYPDNADCDWTITATNGRQVFLELVEFDVEKCCDYLEIFDGPYKLGRYSGTFDSEVIFISKHNQLRLNFVTDTSVSMKGFRAKYKQVDACGNRLSATAAPQTFSTSNFPSYANDVDCLWVITAAAGKYVELTILELDTQACCDYLQIYEGNNIYAKVSGSNLPDQTLFTSMENKLFVYFHSDETIKGRGARATYKEVVCGGTFNLTGNEVKTLTSPGYPVSYKENLNCEYVFEAETGREVEIEITADVEDCCDFLQIFDGEKSLGLLSGNITSYTFQSTEQTLRVIFTSDSTVQRSGYQIKYKQTGTIVPPGEVRTCSITGDPHFTTFDGTRYDFHGICSYVLVQFNVSTGKKEKSFIVENLQQHLGNSTAVAYNQAVVATIDGLKIEITQSGDLKVGDKGKTTNYPFHHGKSLSVSIVGKTALIKTDFGLEVRYDIPFNLYIKLPSSFAGKVTGLCGNYNGVPGDDFPRNHFTLNRFFLDQSYSDKFQTATKKCDKPNPPPPTSERCTSSEKAIYQKNCSMVNNITGPFRNCIPHIDPEPFFEDCVFDACAFEDAYQAIIDNFADYETKCLAVPGILVDDWRNNETRVVCPKNQHYDQNTTDCQPSCSDPNPTNCSGVYRACVCDEGFLLSDTECVPVSECGCTKDDEYYKNGESFYNRDCSSRCWCQNSTLTCKFWSCEKGSTCGIDRKKRFACVAESKAKARAVGDPHYTTFDGRRYDFMGVGTFVLSETKGRNQTDQRWFRIECENERRNGNTRVSYVREMTIKLPGNNIIQLKKDQVILLNGKVIQSFESQEFSIQIAGLSSIVTTKYGMVTSFSYNHVAEVTLPSTYKNQIRGLFSNFDGVRENDIGGSIEEINNFAKQFQVGSSAIYPRSSVTCSIANARRWSRSTECGRLTNPTGAFSACHSTIPVDNYFEDCVFDVCATGGSREMLKNAFEDYAAACLAREVNLCDWREETGTINQNCPANSHYEGCASPCPKTCASPYATDNCNIDGKVEACVCNFGFVRDGEKCVRLSHCNSVDKDEQIVPGNTYLGVVVDTTGSMSSIINQIKFWLNDCTTTVTCGFITTGGWILSPFNDPGTGPVVGPTNRTEYLRGVNGMRARGGGDCPEKGFTGILNALLKVPSDSVFCRLFYFSDAYPKDTHLSAQIQAKLQETRCQLIVFQSNCCSTCPDPNGNYERISNRATRELYRIAYISGGRVALISLRSTTEDFVKFVENLV